MGGAERALILVLVGLISPTHRLATLLAVAAAFPFALFSAVFLVFAFRTTLLRRSPTAAE